MRKALSVAIVVALAACHKAPQVEPQPRADRVIGDFSFQMNVGAIPVAGEFSIESDTVTLEAAEHSCRRLDRGLRDAPTLHSFSCGGGPTLFTVVVDSKRPALSRWGSTKPVTSSQMVCDRYAINKDRQQVCVSSRKETVTEQVPIGGRIPITRVATLDKP